MDQFNTISEAERILERITDAFYALDLSWRFTYVNAQAERLLHRKREDLLGKCVWDEFPEAVGSKFMSGYEQAMSEQITVRISDFYEPLSTWFDVTAFPSNDGLSVYFRDVTAQKASDAQQLHKTEGERDTFVLLAETSGEFIGMCDLEGNPFYGNPTALRLVGIRDLEQLVKINISELFFPEDRPFVFDEFLPRVLREDKGEVEIRFRNVQTNEAKWLRWSVFPLKDAAGNPTGFGTISRDITQERLDKAEQARLANTNRLLLESSREGIYSMNTAGRFTSANSAAMEMLGYDIDEILECEAHPLIHHTHVDGSAHRLDECRIHRVLNSGKSYHVEDDIFWRKGGHGFRVAYTASPIVVDGVVEGVVVNFSDITERIALEETREALFTRDRNIAEQLQVALQPDVPDRVPGLAVAKYYEAALTNEANVGGDFYDVFSIKKGVTALIVGDLSGKGLLAAAQVATVRNMLRAFLLTRPTISSALNALNKILARHAMLKGFATLFVGTFNESTRTLTYVNCGQEPALIRRFNTQEIEQLQSTGPVMGAFIDARYREKSTPMSHLDALAVFTDGFTEVGPSHSDMLEIDGVIALLKQDFRFEVTNPPASIVRTIRRTLIQGVNEAAKGGDIRDDMCLLVAVVD